MPKKTPAMQDQSRVILFVTILFLSAFLLFKLFWTYISAIVLALLIASAFYPLYTLLRRALFRDKETPASLFMCLFILLVIVLPLGGFVGTLSNEAFDFYSRTRSSVSLIQIQEMLESDSPWVQRIRGLGRLTGVELNPGTLQSLATSVGKNVGLFLSRQLSSFASNLLSFLVHFFLMMMIIYSIFRDGVRLKEYISALLPLPLAQQELIVNKFREMGRAVILGNGLSGIVQGILGGVGFYLFGLGSPFLWGTLIGFMAFLPVIGASIVFGPAAVILMVQGESALALGYLAYNIGYSSLIEYVIKPRLIGRGMRMNSLLVFIGILGGIKLFGILGVVYGPLIITIFLTLAEIYRLEYRWRSTGPEPR